MAAALEMFSDTGVTISHGHLGARVGSGKREATEAKVRELVAELSIYERFANREPQIAHKLLSYSMIPRWKYWQRVTPDTGPVFAPVEDAVTRVIATITGIPICPARRSISSLPCRKGGLSLPSPVASASSTYATAIESTKVLREAIVYGTEYEQKQHHEQMANER